MGKVGDFIEENMRVLRVTKKPTMEEYKTTVKVAALGMAAIGLIGFTIFMIKELIFR